MHLKINSFIVLIFLFLGGLANADSNRTLTVKLSWDSGSELTDLDLYIKNPKGEICNWSNRNTNWGATHERDDRGVKNGNSYESFTVDLNSMDCYSSGDYEFHIHHYSGPTIESTFTTSMGHRWTFQTSSKEDKYAVRYRADSSSCQSKYDYLTVKNIPSIMKVKDWPLAAKFMEHWFNGSGKNYMISLYELTDISDKASNAISEWEDLAHDNELIDGTILNYLIEGLKNTPNNRGGMVIPDGGSFNHIETEMSLAGNTWHDLDWEKRNMNWIKEKVISSGYFELSHFRAAFAMVVLRLVAAGEVIVRNGYATINILEVGIYVRDSYDFIDEDENDSQELGCWSSKEPYVSFNSFWLDDPKICVTNKSFRDYNRNHGKSEHYGDFRIFSNPKSKIIHTNQSFDYELTSSVAAGDNCGSNKIYDCELKCVNKTTAMNWIGDNYCDDGTWGIVLTCPAFNNDKGDCN